MNFIYSQVADQQVSWPERPEFESNIESVRNEKLKTYLQKYFLGITEPLWLQVGFMAVGRVQIRVWFDQKRLIVLVLTLPP